MAVSFIGRGNRNNRMKSEINDKLYHMKLYRVHPAWAGFKLTALVVIDTGCIGSNKSNYHTITTTTAPASFILYIHIQYTYHLELANKAQKHCEHVSYPSFTSFSNNNKKKK